MLNTGELKISVIGLGYVGLPLAVEFLKKYSVVGFDLDRERVDELQSKFDRTMEVSRQTLEEAATLTFSSSEECLVDCNVFVVSVPTPIDAEKRPDFSPLKSASKTLAKYMSARCVVIFESTVYPGATEEICVPILESGSGLRYNKEFFVGYSPERINPGDKTRALTDIKKVTSGSTVETADFVDALYASIIKAGTHKASSIAVAEAAKVIENTQRDVNIALINELALIFDRLRLYQRSIKRSKSSGISSHLSPVSLVVIA